MSGTALPLRGEGAAVPRRGALQGTIQILRYNWPFYAVSLVVLVGLGVALWRLSLNPVLSLLGILALAASAFWMLGSIVASYLVYDHSGLCRWEWIAPLLSRKPDTWANLHSGLDEATPSLLSLFPHSQGYVFDFYDPVTMTEPSIRRARRLTPPVIAPTAVNSAALPLADDTLDAIFLLFAAHEIRDKDDRLRFFQELHRILRPGGRIVIAEHLRDVRNFIAFGPGFLHFLPRGEWLRLAHQTGLRVVQASYNTPLTCAFVLEKPQEAGE